MASRFVCSSLVVAVLLGGGLARAAEPPSPGCTTPAARLEGERALLAPIRASLQARGVSEGGALPCQRLEVRVLAASPGYDLFLTDAEGRTDRRRIARADTAAMVIESWLQADESDPLLDRMPPAGAPAADAPPAVMAAADSPPAGAALARALVSVAAASAAPARASRALVSVRGDSAVEAWEAVWWGVAAGACFRVGPLCAGPEAGFRFSSGAPGFTPIAAPVWQERKLENLRSFEGGVRVEAPLALGPLRLLPGLFLGAGHLAGRWHNDDLEQPDRERRNNRGDGRGDRSGGQNDAQVGPYAHHEPFSQLGLRAAAGLGLAVPVAWGVAVELHLSAGLRPVAPGLRVGGDEPMVAGLVGHAGAGLGLRYGVR